ncbi:MAG: DUF1015 domain-containing protein [Christensenellaceae bacterium]|jgi:hypothetical protein|nr:DUF1015 domain-containing protein [Christensenellaceae bacterium]
MTTPRGNLSFAQMGLHLPTILLPQNPSDPRWPAIACDQYTAQPEVWQAFAKAVGSAPSTLSLILPEAYLAEGEKRLPVIWAAMREYQKNVLTTAFEGFVLVARHTASGTRLGLVLAVNLERYAYLPGSNSDIRCTEGTILSRLPARMGLREGAELESSHVMLLADDVGNRLLPPLYEALRAEKALYDLELLQGGGRLCGWAVEGEKLEQARAALSELYRGKGEKPFIAVGDGNHSLASAKAVWEKIKAGLSAGERESHPARYALCELVNLHDPALNFEPIHRALFGVEIEALERALGDFASVTGQGRAPSGQEALLVSAKGERLYLNLPLVKLQAVIDELGVECDYVHGGEVARELGRREGNAAFLLPKMEKLELFSSIQHGPLPRKAFSMGEANEKRYYMECRRIRP